MTGSASTIALSPTQADIDARLARAVIKLRPRVAWTSSWAVSAGAEIDAIADGARLRPSGLPSAGAVVEAVLQLVPAWAGRYSMVALSRYGLEDRRIRNLCYAALGGAGKRFSSSSDVYAERVRAVMSSDLTRTVLNVVSSRVERLTGDVLDEAPASKGPLFSTRFVASVCYDLSQACTIANILECVAGAPEVFFTLERDATARVSLVDLAETAALVSM